MVTSGPSRADADGRRRRRQLPLWQETILLLVIALGLAVIIKAFFVQAFYIPSPSMEPGLVPNDRILVQKVSYWTHPPRRGDVVVFGDPGHWLPADDDSSNTGLRKLMEVVGLYPAGGHLVKRVIGVGGDEVKCCDSQGRVTVNGHPLNEKSYLPKGTVPSLTTFDVKVPKGYLWVMGDNRGDSADSRAHMKSTSGRGGFVSDDLVVGRVFAIVWPASRLTIIHRPGTFASVPTT